MDFLTMTWWAIAVLLITTFISQFTTFTWAFLAQNQLKKQKESRKAIQKITLSLLTSRDTSLAAVSNPYQGFEVEDIAAVILKVLRQISGDSKERFIKFLMKIDFMSRLRDRVRQERNPRKVISMIEFLAEIHKYDEDHKKMDIELTVPFLDTQNQNLKLVTCLSLARYDQVRLLIRVVDRLLTLPDCSWVYLSVVMSYAPQAFKVSYEMFATHPDERVRKAALMTMADVGGLGRPHRLMKRIRTDSALAVRVAAMRAMSKKNFRVPDDFIQKILNDKENRLVLSAITYVQDMKLGTQLPILLKLATDEAFEVAYAAIKAIYSFGRAGEILIEKVQAEAKPVTRRFIKNVVKEIAADVG